MLMLWVAMVGPRIVGSPVDRDAGTESERSCSIEGRVLTDDADGQVCVALHPEPGSTMLRVGWATTTLKLTVSTSVPVVKINRFVWAWVAVMVMLAKL